MHRKQNCYPGFYLDSDYIILLQLALCNVMTKSKMLLPGHILRIPKRLNNIIDYLIFFPGVMQADWDQEAVLRDGRAPVFDMTPDSIMFFHL